MGRHYVPLLSASESETLKRQDTASAPETAVYRITVTVYRSGRIAREIVKKKSLQQAAELRL